MLGGTLVFRKVGNKTVVSTVPSTSKEPTEAQQAQRVRFQQAVLYAKAQMAEPVIKAEYESKAKGVGAPNAYNIAVADFFNAPDILEVDVSKYTGQVNEPIRVKVTDDFKVMEVSVEIFNPDGALVEKGLAIKQANNLDWIFTSTVMNNTIAGDKIVIKASDLPGNITTNERNI